MLFVLSDDILRSVIERKCEIIGEALNRIFAGLSLFVPCPYSSQKMKYFPLRVCPLLLLVDSDVVPSRGLNAGRAVRVVQ